MADKKLVTKEPKGVVITRKNSTFTASWKIADKDYGDGQSAQYKIGSNKWTDFEQVGIKTTKKSFSVSTNKYYPNKSSGKYKPKLKRVQVRIKGNRKAYTVKENGKDVRKNPSASEWSPMEFEILPPNNPKVSVAVGVWPTATFSWEVKVDNTAHKWFDHVEWQHVLLVNSNKNASELTENEWNGTASNARDAHSGTSTRTTNDVLVEETSSTFEIGKSYTRYFRIRSYGIAGVPVNKKNEEIWAYGKHVYADSQQAEITKYVVNKNDDVSGYTCQIYFNAPLTRKFPIDQVITQYALAIPTEGMEPPDGISWSNGLTSIPKNTAQDKNSAIFTIDQLPSVDQCLFVRVNTIYDNRTTYGVPKLVDSGILAAPSGLTVDVDTQTYRATVTANNNSAVSDSFLVVNYATEDNPEGIDIGMIPFGNTKTIVDVEPWQEGEHVSFGVYAAVGDVKGYGKYVLTEDTEKDPDKTYYRMMTGGSVNDPDSFAVVPPLGVIGTLAVRPFTVTSMTGSMILNEPSEYSQIQFMIYSSDYSQVERTVYFTYGTQESITITLNEPLAFRPENQLTLNYDGNFTVEYGFQYATIYSYFFEAFQAEDYNPSEEGFYEIEESKMLRFAVTPIMKSVMVRDGGEIPTAPENVKAFQHGTRGTIRVTWDWAWEEADRAEISWSDHSDAWESTDEPSTFIVSKMRNSALNISGLETGIDWYVRVRLISGMEDEATYGPYSEIKTVNLASAPAIPVIELSEPVITESGSTTASWGYTTTDGTGQLSARLVDVDDNNQMTEIDTVGSEQSYILDAAKLGWQAGETHRISVRVTSESGKESDNWSVPVAVTIAEPLVCEITSTSLVEETETVVSQIEDSDETETVEVTRLALKEMPLTVSVTGVGDAGITSLIVERKEAYQIRRPNETDQIGFAGETIVLSQTNEQESEFEIDNNSLDKRGSFDDGAWYTLTATVKDNLGQVAYSDPIDFIVNWTDQAIRPEANVEIDTNEMVAFLTPIAPTGARVTDTCDIYRLSVDAPELIYSGAVFGETYVDPYPAIGQFGGHRFVMVTENGDYITDDPNNDYSLSWLDTGETENDRLDSEYSIIEFGDGRVMLDRNVDLSNSWTKNFKETHYLGGKVEGDWLPDVSRSGSINTVAITLIDQDTIENMRRLATYSGECHVRSVDGSSYAANVEVTENYSHDTGKVIASFSLKITCIEPERLDGLTYDEWESMNNEVP